MITNLNGIRGILFLLIFGTHFKYIIMKSDIGHMLYNPLDHGYFAVLFFFLLSGFCMALGYSDSFEIVTKNNYKEYIKKRLIKFYPLYIITGLIILIFKNLPENLNYIYVFLFLYIPMLFPWSKFPSGGGNRSGWFLADLFYCYLLTPFIMYLMNKVKTLKQYLLICSIIYIILIVIGIIIFKCNKDMSIYCNTFPLIRLLQYTLGISLGIIYKKYCSDKISLLLNNCIHKNIVDIFVLILLINLMLSRCAKGILFINLLCVPIISLFIFYLCINGKSILKYLLNNPIVNFLSNISFEGYLIHDVVLVFLTPYCLNYIYTVKGITSIFILLFGITILISYTYKISYDKIFTFIKKYSFKK